MKALKKTSAEAKMSAASAFILRYVLSAFGISALAFMLLRFPFYSAEGARKGISICLESLIPSLYPFMIISDIFVLSSLAEMKLPFFERLCRFLFRLPASAMPVIFFSFIGGLPVGAKMSAQLYERGLITERQCARMLCFCVNPGPAFVISAVGSAMLGSEKTGLVIYISLVISSLIIGILSRFFASPEEPYTPEEKHRNGISEAGNLIEKAVLRSSKAILAVCSWVVAFSCVGELVSILAVSEGAKDFILCIIEMTRGCLVAAEGYPAPIIAAVIGFSGICGHLQLAGALRVCSFRYKYFLIARIVNGGLAAVICGFLLKLFPVASETFAVGAKPQSATTSGSLMLSALMIVMAILFVLGEDYKVVRKKV